MEKKPRLLLVDNDREFIRKMKTDLEDSGFEILYSHTGLEARQMVEYDQPDIVVAEVMLERHDSGFDLAKHVKGDPRFRHIPVILLTRLTQLTGYQFSLKNEGYWMKADDYIEKPLSAADLVSRINRLLNKESEIS